MLILVFFLCNIMNVNVNYIHVQTYFAVVLITFFQSCFQLKTLVWVLIMIFERVAAVLTTFQPPPPPSFSQQLFPLVKIFPFISVLIILIYYYITYFLTIFCPKHNEKRIRNFGYIFYRVRVVKIPSRKARHLLGESHQRRRHCDCLHHLCSFKLVFTYTAFHYYM